MTHTKHFDCTISHSHPRRPDCLFRQSQTRKATQTNRSNCPSCREKSPGLLFSHPCKNHNGTRVYVRLYVIARNYIHIALFNAFLWRLCVCCLRAHHILWRTGDWALKRKEAFTRCRCHHHYHHRALKFSCVVSFLPHEDTTLIILSCHLPDIVSPVGWEYRDPAWIIYGS